MESLKYNYRFRPLTGIMVLIASRSSGINVLK